MTEEYRSGNHGWSYESGADKLRVQGGFNKQDFVGYHNKYAEIANPPPPEWKMKVANITYHCPKGKHPNAFHRFMQKLILGFEWSRI